MKAIEEIGYKKAVKFLVFSVYKTVYDTFVFFLPFPHVRKLLLEAAGTKISKNSVIMNVSFFNTHHSGFKGLKIGEDCFVGDGTLIDLYEKVVLEDQVTIAQNVTILTHTNVGYKNHPLQKYFPKTAKPVVFKKGCVVGAASVILPGVTIGEGSFVGAGSVVTKNVSSNSLYVGNPAKFIRKIAK